MLKYIKQSYGTVAGRLDPVPLFKRVKAVDVPSPLAHRVRDADRIEQLRLPQLLPEPTTALHRGVTVVPQRPRPPRLPEVRGALQIHQWYSVGK